MKSMLFFIAASSLFFPQTIKSSSPLERSNEFIANWTSKKCQDFQNKGFFVTSENMRSCANGNKERRCPRLFKWPEFPQLTNPVSPCLDTLGQGHIDRRDAIVSHEHKFIYANVPKVGTQTIKELLSREFKVIDNRGSFEAFTKVTGQSSVPNYDEYFVFTFVRDPLARMESAIGQARLFMIKEDPITFLNLMSQGCIVEQHVITQSKFLKIQNPFTKKDLEYSFIGSLENINEDIEFLLPILKAAPKDRKGMMKTMSLMKASTTAATTSANMKTATTATTKALDVPKALPKAPMSKKKQKKLTKTPSPTPKPTPKSKMTTKPLKYSKKNILMSNLLLNLDGSPIIRHKNKGREHFHRMFDYSVPHIRQKMQDILQHDYACFPTYKNVLLE